MEKFTHTMTDTQMFEKETAAANNKKDGRWGRSVLIFYLTNLK